MLEPGKRNMTKGGLAEDGVGAESRPEVDAWWPARKKTECEGDELLFLFLFFPFFFFFLIGLTSGSSVHVSTYRIFLPTQRL
jgi:hypothetical protein